MTAGGFHVHDNTWEAVSIGRGGARRGLAASPFRSPDRSGPDGHLAAVIGRCAAWRERGLVFDRGNGGFVAPTVSGLDGRAAARGWRPAPGADRGTPARRC